MRCRSNCVVCGFMSEGVLLCWAQRMGEVRNIPRSKGNFKILGIRPAKIRASRALIRGRVENFMSASLKFTVKILSRYSPSRSGGERDSHGRECDRTGLNFATCPLSARCRRERPRLSLHLRNCKAYMVLREQHWAQRYNIFQRPSI